MKILVTGAAGFIGSVVVDRLVHEGHQVTAIDNLSNGRREAVNPKAHFAQVDLRDRTSLSAFMRDRGLEAVCHLAASAVIDGSATDVFQNNVAGTANLLAAMKQCGCFRLLFSSSAAVYGDITDFDPHEMAYCVPCNAYGQSKLMCEEMFDWAQADFGLSATSFRYFNVCGASHRRWENRPVETHLIPRLIAAAENGTPFDLFGRGYPTKDGTCVRDYVHVEDIASAHILALAQPDPALNDVFNLGSGKGYSNIEVLQEVKNVTNKPIMVMTRDARRGDPARLVADISKANRVLGWSPQYLLHAMIYSAYAFPRCNP